MRTATALCGRGLLIFAVMITGAGIDYAVSGVKLVGVRWLVYCLVWGMIVLTFWYVAEGVKRRILFAGAILIAYLGAGLIVSAALGDVLIDPIAVCIIAVMPFTLPPHNPPNTS